jgi:hypothetical protein
VSQSLVQDNPLSLETWSKNLFDPQKDTTIDWIKRHGLVSEMQSESVDDTAIKNRLRDFKNESTRLKEEVKAKFMGCMLRNFSLAAKICGLVYPDPQLDDMLVSIRESTDIGKSVAHDSTKENLERVSWTLYYSSTIIYKTIFGMEMSDYYEPLIMKQLGACYEETTDKSGKGCVAMLLNKMLNRYRSGAQESMKTNKNCTIAGINSNAPANLDKQAGGQKKTPSDKSYVFWIGTKNGTEKVVNKEGKEEEKVKIEWRWVRTLYERFEMLKIEINASSLFYFQSDTFRQEDFSSSKNWKEWTYTFQLNMLFEHMRGLNKIDPICINPVEVQLNPTKYKAGSGLDQISGSGLVRGGLLEQPVVTRRETGTQGLDIAVPRHRGGLDFRMPQQPEIEDFDSLLQVSPLPTPERGFGYPTRTSGGASHLGMGLSIGTVPNGQWHHRVRGDFSTGNVVRKAGFVWPCVVLFLVSVYTNTWGRREEPRDNARILTTIGRKVTSTASNDPEGNS